MVVLQTPGLSEREYRYRDHVTLRLHTAGPYLTDDVTSEGSLLRGLIEKGTIQLHKPVFLFIHFLEFSFHFQFELFVDLLKERFESQVLTMSNREKTLCCQSCSRALIFHLVASVCIFIHHLQEIVT